MPSAAERIAELEALVAALRADSAEREALLVAERRARADSEMRAHEPMRAEAELRAVLDAMPVAVVLLESGRAIMHNTAAAGMIGLDEDGRIDAIALAAHLPELRDLAAKAVNAAPGVACAAIAARMGGERPRDVLLSVTPLGGEGMPRRMLAVLHDVSERRDLERQLLQAQKMEAIGKLAGGVAHDFNNLLMVISGRAELIANRSAEGTPVRRDADLISETSGRAARLTRQLLAFSRRQPFAARELDLNEVVGEMATMLRSLIGEDIEFVIDLGRDLPKVISDPSHIEQVVLNLVVNARDAMAHGGQLTLATRQVVSDGRDPRTPPAGRHVALTVSDTGVGMDEATRLHIFEPFFTTKAAGTGLGLSTVYGIVQQSGGHIAVDSAPGAGTSFTICLPAIATAPARVRTPPDGTRLHETGHAGATVLVVEDEDHVRELLREILEDHGFKVLSAARASEAVAQLQRAHVDLLVTDLVMPQTGGRELAERLRVLTPDLRVLFMSGYADVQPEAGEARLLAKPFTAQALIDAVHSALDTAAAG